MFGLFEGLLGIFESLYFFALHISGGGAFPRTLNKAEEAECLRVLSWDKRRCDAERSEGVVRECNFENEFTQASESSSLKCVSENKSAQAGEISVSQNMRERDENCTPFPVSGYTEAEVRAARDKLVTHNLRLVAHVIKKYYAAYSDQDDLISIGTIGLIKGINSFDPDKGTKLATYAARCIENEILMYFRSQKNKQQYVLMGEPIDMDSEGNPLTIMDVICDETDMAEDVEMKIKAEQALWLVSQIKDEREKEIIILRYGLNNQKPLTQREVAKLLGISRSYVSRIEKKVLENLRAEFE